MELANSIRARDDIPSAKLIFVRRLKLRERMNNTNPRQAIESINGKMAVYGIATFPVIAGPLGPLSSLGPLTK